MLDDKELLSEVVIHNKYAKYIPELQRRETWAELVARNKAMHLKKYPKLGDLLDKAYQLVLDKKVLPSMRAMQFAGKPIEMNPARGYNCSFVAMNHYKAFSETMYLLLSGCGVGFSVQKHHTQQLPKVLKPNYQGSYTNSRRYLISDDIEGWAETIKILLKSYFFGTNEIRFDYTGIRAKGMRLVSSGGKAPGHEPLEECVNRIKVILDKKEVNSQLTPLEVHDIQCHIANAVLAGGIRRSATISLFDFDDIEMLECKKGAWWEKNEQRGRANNSAVLLRGSITAEQFFSIWKRIQESGSGEPGIFWTNDKEMGTNPCCFVGETKLLTEDGYVTMSELATSNAFFVCIDSEGSKKLASVWKSKFDAPITTVTLSNGKVIRCTSDHLFLAANGETVEARNLKGWRLAQPTDVDFDTSVDIYVVSVEAKEGDIADVYDFTIQGDNHWGVVEGVIAHNCEIALRTFCNLTEINASNITSQEDFNARVAAAAVIGTLQASYTDFHYLRPFWKQYTEEDALLGIGLTGIASNIIFDLDIEEAIAIAVKVNKDLAAMLGINPAKRIGCVKPSGTTSLVLGTSSGVHAWHSEYYLRSMRINKQEDIYNYLIDTVPNLMEDCVFSPSTTAILRVPQKAPIDSITRSESPLELLERVKLLHEKWIKPSHVEGVNTHNVSVTVSIKDNEWEAVGDWMWLNKDSYAGISVLPFDGGTYVQAPFEDITEERYNELVKYLGDIDLSNVIESDDHTNMIEGQACAGGACEIK